MRNRKSFQDYFNLFYLFDVDTDLILIINRHEHTHPIDTRYVPEAVPDVASTLLELKRQQGEVQSTRLCWEVTCSGGFPGEKKRFGALMSFNNNSGAIMIHIYTNI